MEGQIIAATLGDKRAEVALCSIRRSSLLNVVKISSRRHTPAMGWHACRTSS